MNHLTYAAGTLSTSGVQRWIETNAIPLLILIVGAGIFFLAQKQNHKGAVSRVGIVLIALVVIGMAATWGPVSKALVHLVGL